MTPTCSTTPASDLLQPRSGQKSSSFVTDDQLQKMCMSRLHAWLAPGPEEAVNTQLGPAPVYDYDALLARPRDGRTLRLEYKWDRYRPFNWSAELIAKDRGDGAALGYVFKQGYDWLVYGFVQTGDIFFFEAQAVRKYAFAFWRARNFGAAHCANANRDKTAAWNLLIPVDATFGMLGQHGLGFKVTVPKELFSPGDALPCGPAAEAQRKVLLELLEQLMDVKQCKPWRPSASEHWEGLVDHLLDRNARRAKFKPAEIEKSELASRDWVALAQEQGLMRD